MAVLLASNFTWGWSGATILILLPDHAKNRGIDSIRISQLLMIVGALGFGGRFATAVLCKLNSTHPSFALVHSGYSVLLLK